MKKFGSPALRRIEGELEKVARVMSDNWGVRVVFTGSKCNTNGSVIRLPYNAEHLSGAKRVVLCGQLDHEVAHVAEERDAAARGIVSPMVLLNSEPSKSVRFLFNVFEDLRIEKKYSAMYPGVAANIRAMNENCAETKKTASPNFWVALGCSIIAATYGLDTSAYPAPIMSWHPLLEEELAAIPSMVEAADAYALARRTHAKILAIVEELKKDESSGEGESSDEEGGDELAVPGGAERKPGKDGSEGEEKESGSEPERDDEEDDGSGASSATKDGSGEDEAPEADDVDDGTADDESGASGAEGGEEDESESGEASSGVRDDADEGAANEEGETSDEGAGEEASPAESDEEGEAAGDEEGGEESDLAPSGGPALPGAEDEDGIPSTDESETPHSGTRSGEAGAPGASDSDDKATDDSPEVDCAEDDLAESDTAPELPKPDLGKDGEFDPSATEADEEDLTDVSKREMEEAAAADMRDNRRYVPHPLCQELDAWIRPTGENVPGTPDALADYQEALADVSKQVSTMKQKLLSIIRTMKQAREVGDQEMGGLDAASLYTLKFGEKRVFTKTVPGLELDTAVTVVVDLSGSMRKRKALDIFGRPRARRSGLGAASITRTRMWYAHRLAIALAETFESISVPCEVVGFHNNMDRYPKSVKIDGYDPNGYQKREPFDFYLFKSHDARLRSCREGFAEMDGYHDNADGEAIRVFGRRLAARKEKQKFMFVISDGAPLAQGAQQDMLCADLRAAIKELTKVEIDVFGIGVQTTDVQNFYNKSTGAENVVIDDLETLAPKVVAVVRAKMLNAARRRQ